MLAILLQPSCLPGLFLGAVLSVLGLAVAGAALTAGAVASGAFMSEPCLQPTACALAADLWAYQQWSGT
jgi:hypothetical protein